MQAVRTLGKSKQVTHLPAQENGGIISMSASISAPNLAPAPVGFLILNYLSIYLYNV